MNTNKINFLRLFIFIILSIGISNIFRFDLFEIRLKLENLSPILYIFSSVLLEGCGVIIAALIAREMLRKERPVSISFWGDSKKLSLLMSIVPLIIVGIIGVTNEYEINPKVYGLLVIVGSLIYCVFEEYGWRGYLEEEFKFLNPYLKYVLIGLIWYVWHLSFLTEASLSENLFFLGVLILGSWGIGQVVSSTKSILASACFHLIIQIMSFNSLIKNGLSGNHKIIILITTITIWMIMLNRWGKKQQKLKEF